MHPVSRHFNRRSQLGSAQKQHKSLFPPQRSCLTTSCSELTCPQANSSERVARSGSHFASCLCRCCVPGCVSEIGTESDHTDKVRPNDCQFQTFSSVILGPLASVLSLPTSSVDGGCDVQDLTPPQRSPRLQCGRYIGLKQRKQVRPNCQFKRRKCLENIALHNFRRENCAFRWRHASTSSHDQGNNARHTHFVLDCISPMHMFL